ncbi:MAG: calcium/sodium antiporter [Paludibacteraceae bacterium]|nr:calcium/sodium antiporter [Paludibacteraceae bacterium]
MFDFLIQWLENGGIGLAALLIIVGFVLLIFSADWLVDGASGLAKHYGVSNLVIGLTVVAFGTSMPEFVVNMVAAMDHNTEIAITNILGSNAINTFVILGMTALIYPISSQPNCRKFDIPWSLLAGILVFLFATYTRPVSVTWGNWGAFSFQRGFITKIGGTVFLLCFILFLWHSIHFAKQGSEEGEDIKIMRLPKALVLIIIGLLGLIVGGEVIVKSATHLAHDLGVNDAIIGLTVVALGTSLPELATSCVAAAKHNCDLALGNVIGSNIFNIFFILGVSAMITPLPIYCGLWLDSLMVGLSALMVMLFVYCNREHKITRWHGALMLIVYAAYLTYRLTNL